VKPQRIACSFVILTALAGAAPGLAAASPQDAKPTASADADADTRAAHLLIQGNKAFKEGRLAEAESAYREAFALKKGYDIAGNLGAVEQAQGKRREAAQHFAFTLRAFPLTGDPALREQMQRALDQCRQEVGAVKVKLDLPGAHVAVDGVPYGEAPLLDDVYVEPGEHVITASLDGYRGESQRVIVPKGETVAVVLDLAPLPPPLLQRLPPPVTPAPRRPLGPGIVLAGVAVAGVIAGGAFLGASAGKRADAVAMGTPIRAAGKSCVTGAPNYDSVGCPPLVSTLHADDTFHDAGVGAFIVGGAAAVGAAAYFLWPQRQARRTGHALQVTPILGPGDGGVLVSGAF
jgi:PEGA domain